MVSNWQKEVFFNPVWHNSYQKKSFCHDVVNDVMFASEHVHQEGGCRDTLMQVKSHTKLLESWVNETLHDHAQKKNKNKVIDDIVKEEESIGHSQ